MHRYPYNLDFDFTPLEGLQRFSINNLGGTSVGTDVARCVVMACCQGRCCCCLSWRLRLKVAGTLQQPIMLVLCLADPFIESNYGVHSREFEVRLHQQPHRFVRLALL